MIFFFLRNFETRRPGEWCQQSPRSHSFGEYSGDIRSSLSERDVLSKHLILRTAKSLKKHFWGCLIFKSLCLELPHALFFLLISSQQMRLFSLCHVDCLSWKAFNHCSSYHPLDIYREAKIFSIIWQRILHPSIF